MGTSPASNVYIGIDFGDYLQPQSSTIPWSTISGNVYTFPVGTLGVYDEGSFRVTALLGCNAQLNSTQCVTAHIYPDSLCFSPPTGWDKSETTVAGTCVNDSLVCFTIKNRSSPPSGNMQGSAPWRLYVNDTLITQGTYQLAGQDSMLKCYPANGKTYRLEADQNPPHPRTSRPRAIVEACGSPENFGFVNTVSQDDEDLFVETYCAQVVGSYDPNDKQVSPIGVSSYQYISAEDELEYLVRFQNTGNDTAFKVIIRDSYDFAHLDVATLILGVSSHPYTFNIYGQGLAEWTFDNILLPDSNVNEPESHGFVKFKIKQLPGNPDGTLIENRAAIYFDFNAPVITNTAWNEVNEANMPVSFLSVGINSFQDITTCHGDSSGTASISATGGLIPYQYSWSNGATTATVNNLLAGNYSVTITDATGTALTDSVTITEPSLLSATIISQTNVLCYANGTGSATVAASGGIAPYSYEWSNQGSAFATANFLHAGTYTVTVWDANFCTTTASVSLTEPTQLFAPVSTQSQITCFGESDAAAKVNATGGVPPYDFLWSNGETDASAENLSAGNYQITVTDSNGCWLVTSVTIQDGYQVNTGNITGADSADINQSATYTVNAGLNYTWSVSNGVILSGQGTNSVEVDWSSTGQGTIQVIATDQGCSETVTKTVTLVDPTGINDPPLDGITVVPNPAKEKVFIQWQAEAGITQIILMDICGKELQKVIIANANHHELSLKDYSQGIYLITVKGNGQKIMRIVKLD